MFLRSNLPTIFERTRHLPRVLDIGGVFGPLNTATHIVDVMPYSSMRGPLDAQEPPRYSEDNFAQIDICARPWPFPDKFFDFAFSAGTMEDVRDPVGACYEMMRVAKAGYLEVPSRIREVFHHKRGYFWRRLLGRPVRVGYGHHRWLVDRTETGLSFTMKHSAVFLRSSIITRADIGRDLSPEESSIGFFWEGAFDVSERLLIEPGEVERDFAAFRKEAIATLRLAQTPANSR
jgi:hypothetical protein